MISKKFLGILALVFLASFLLLTNISAVNDCTCSGGSLSVDNCYDCYAPQCTGITSCVCNAALGNGESCSYTCTDSMDQCPLASTKNHFVDYLAGSGSGICMGGVCNFQSCSIEGEGWCSSSNECGTPEYCGSGYLKCVFSQSKLASPYYGWVDNSVNNEDPGGTSALDCSDGHDNDCDGLIDCQESACVSQPNCQTTNPSSPKLIFRQGVGPSNAAVIGSNGVMDIRLTNFSNQGTITSTTNDFIIKNSVGTIVAMISNSGNLYLRGQIYPNQATLSSYLTNGQSDFIVKNSTGSVVAVIDLSGNLRLSQGLRTNKVP